MPKTPVTLFRNTQFLLSGWNLAEKLLRSFDALLDAFLLQHLGREKWMNYYLTVTESIKDAPRTLQHPQERPELSAERLIVPIIPEDGVHFEIKTYQLNQ